MANIDVVHGFNKSSSTNNKLLAVLGNDVVNVDTGLGFNLNLSNPSEVTISQFLDRAFLNQWHDTTDYLPQVYDGTSWNTTNAYRMPMAKYQRPFKERLYLGYCRFYNPRHPYEGASQTALAPFSSRVFYSDLPKDPNTLTWGLEWNWFLKAVQGQRVATFATQVPFVDYKLANIKVGDPLFITYGADGTGIFQTTVASIDSRYQLTVNDPFPSLSAGGVPFWVGGNWFDVGSNDNDFITALSDNDDKLLIFKQFSLWRYDTTSQTLRKVKGAVGTTSSKSVIDIDPYTIYFHASNNNTRKTGFYAYNGSRSFIISRAIQPYIDGLDLTFDPVAWREGSRYRAYVGTITNAARGISVSNAVLTIDLEGNQWSVDPIADLVTSQGKYTESSVEKTFIGTSGSEVMETPSGNNFDGSPIPWACEISPRYPSGSEIINNFTRMQVVSRGGRGLQVSYKLYGTPDDDDDQWTPLGDLEHNHQEFDIPIKHRRGKGMDVRFADSNGDANNFVVQKLTLFYIPESTRNIG